MQAQLQWWIACDPASLRASVSLQHGVGCLCASALGLCAGKAAWEVEHQSPLTWEHSAAGDTWQALPLHGGVSPCWGSPHLGCHREWEDTHHSVMTSCPSQPLAFASGLCVPGADGGWWPRSGCLVSCFPLSVASHEPAPGTWGSTCTAELLHGCVL